MKDPQVVHNGMIMEMDHPIAGKLKLLGNPLIVDGQTLPVRIYPPQQGEHTREILEECGYSRDEATSLLERRIVVCKTYG